MNLTDGEMHLIRSLRLFQSMNPGSVSMVVTVARTHEGLFNTTATVDKSADPAMIMAGVDNLLEMAEQRIVGAVTVDDDIRNMAFNQVRDARIALGFKTDLKKEPT